MHIFIYTYIYYTDQELRNRAKDPEITNTRAISQIFNWVPNPLKESPNSKTKLWIQSPQLAFKPMILHWGCIPQTQSNSLQIAGSLD